MILSKERGALKIGGLPIHPGPAGHQALGQALLPHVLGVLAARKK